MSVDATTFGKIAGIDAQQKAQAKEQSNQDREPTQAERLAKIIEKVTLWHAEDAPWATIEMNGHKEHWPIRSRAFRAWVASQYMAQFAKPPSSQAMEDSLRAAEGKALWGGSEHEVFVRVAGAEGTVYIDMCDPAWRAIEVKPTGWSVVTNPPVRFRRPRKATPLPEPVRGGNINLLRRVLPQLDNQQFLLVAGWLLGTLRPTGPYPILCLQGEQGTGKSTMSRMLRGLVDPGVAPIRSAPRDERDLAVACAHSWVLAIDNLSGLPAWLSDALCRVSTGGGWASRELYSDAEEVVWDYTRPILANGIDDVATRADLMDRSIVVTLQPLPDEKRRTETELWTEYERIRPAVLGALCDAVVEALRRIHTVRLDKLPRMADFALWVTAGETACGWSEGTFVNAYTTARQEAVEVSLDADPVATAVRALLARCEEWKGTATELLTLLTGEATEVVRLSKAWPKSPQSLSGWLRRLAPALRRVGIHCEWSSQGRDANKKRTIRLSKLSSVPNVPSVPKGDLAASEAGTQDDGEDARCVPAKNIASPRKASYVGIGGVGDAGDEEMQTLSLSEVAAVAEEGVL